MANIFTTTPHPFPYYDGQFGNSYRIEIDVTEPHRTFQRHIWIFDDGREEAEAWIPGIKTTAEKLRARNFVAVESELPGCPA